MRSPFAAQAALVRRLPWGAIGIIVILTALFSFGFVLPQSAPQDPNAAFLPEDSELAQAQATIAEHFSGAETQPVQIILRGDAWSPAGLQAMLTWRTGRRRTLTWHASWRPARLL